MRVALTQRRAEKQRRSSENGGTRPEMTREAREIIQEMKETTRDKGGDEDEAKTMMI